MTRVTVDGVGPDAPVVINPVTGAKQSSVDYRCDLLPPLAVLHIAEVLDGGAAKYGDWNWFDISCAEHLNHALIHIFAFLAGDESDDHLGNASCRVLMALERRLVDEKQGANLDMTPHMIGWKRV